MRWRDVSSLHPIDGFLLSVQLQFLPEVHVVFQDSLYLLWCRLDEGNQGGTLVDQDKLVAYNLVVYPEVFQKDLGGIPFVLSGLLLSHVVAGNRIGG